MANIFQELQMLSMSEGNEIVKTRKQLNKIVETFKSLPEYEELILTCSVHLRQLKVETMKNADAFMVQPEWTPAILDEELRHDSLGFCRGSYLVFGGRLVYPVKDTKGDVMGFCGYDKFDDIKYLDSLNNGYKAKATTLYGMERLEEYYRSTKPVFIVEGIVCCLYLRQEGFQSLASLGSYITPYVVQILSRFGHRAVFITDADESGNKYRMQVRRTLPSAQVYQSTIAKDVDDSRLVDPKVVNEFRKFENPFYKGSYFR